MSVFGIDKVRMAGLAVGAPARTIDNLNNPLLSKEEAEAFVNNVGIRYIKRVKNKSLTELFLPVAESLIDKLQWERTDIQLLILITQTPDYKIPPSSLILQNKLGLTKSTIAFDINLGCSGYVYGLSVATSMMQAARIKKALLFVGDISSSCISEKDKSTAPVFSDAVSVTALEYSDDEADRMDFNLQSDGAGYDAIIIKDGGTQNLLNQASLFYNEYEGGLIRRNIDMSLNGIEVFNFSLREVARNIKELLQFKNAQIEHIDFFVMHQANKLMNESIRKKLKIDIEKTPYSLYNYGNTSSASIPLTLAHCINNSLKNKNLKLLLAGFGVGLSWGSVLLRTNKIVCPRIIELKE